MRKALISTICVTAAVALACLPWGDAGPGRIEEIGGTMLAPVAWEAWGMALDYHSGSRGPGVEAEPNWGMMAGMGSRAVVQVALEGEVSARLRPKNDCVAMSIFGSIIRHTLGSRTEKAPGA